jgi:hypothetical protein
MPAGAAADPGETSGEDATADVSVELALHQLRQHLASTCDGGREGRTVMTNRAMQWDVFDVTRAVDRRQRRAGLGAARQPAVAARQRRGRDRGQQLAGDVQQVSHLFVHECLGEVARFASEAVPLGETLDDDFAVAAEVWRLSL